MKKSIPFSRGSLNHFFLVSCNFLALEAKSQKDKSADFMALFGGEELDNNHVNRISVEQMHPS
jgi:hypothetical protein